MVRVGLELEPLTSPKVREFVLLASESAAPLTFGFASRRLFMYALMPGAVLVERLSQLKLWVRLATERPSGRDAFRAESSSQAGQGVPL